MRRQERCQGECITGDPDWMSLAPDWVLLGPPHLTKRLKVQAQPTDTWRMLCPVCGESLRVAAYRDGDRLKSCPQCSARAGRHVFYLLDDFGERRPRGGDPIIQSWCRECREHRPPRPPAAVCAVPHELPRTAPATPEAGESSRTG
jgi:hypothetical protein